MGEPHRPQSRAEHIHREEDCHILIAMSLARSLTLLVVMIALVPQSSPLPQPSISFAALGQQKDNLIRSIGGIKKNLLNTKLGLFRGLFDAKLGLAKTVLRPVAGIKRAKLQAVRGLLDSKINKLSSF